MSRIIIKRLLLMIVLHSGSLLNYGKNIWPKHQKVIEGDPFTIHCTSSEGSLYWSHNQKLVSEDKIRKNSIVVEEAEESDEGIYHCTVNSKKGYYVILEAIVEIIKLMNNRIKPNIKGFQPYSSVFFTCDSSTKIGWTFNGGLLPKNAKQEGDKLFINSARKRNEGRYDCYGTYKNNNSWHIEFAARGTLQMYQKGIVHPEIQRVLIGKQAGFSCTYGNPTKLIWRHNEKILNASNVQKLSAILLITPVYPTNHGIYECLGRTLSGNLFIGFSKLVAVVETKLDPPKLIVVEGDSATFSCLSDTSVTWRLNGKAFLGGHKVLLNSSNYTLTIKAATSKHTGVYSCEGENETGFLAKGFLKVKLKVSHRKPSFRSEYRVSSFISTMTLVSTFFVFFVTV